MQIGCGKTAARSSLSFIAFQGADAWSKTIPNGRAAHGTATAAETIAQNARCFAECMFSPFLPVLDEGIIPNSDREESPDAVDFAWTGVVEFRT